MIRIRIDDFPNTKGEPQHTLAAFREFHKCLSECIGGKRYLLGVIPGRCSVDDILFLRNETNCIIGLHGTDHAEARLDRNGGNQFEPYALVCEVRRELMGAHTALKEAVGRAIKIYMPPRNVIDARTLEILRSESPIQWVTSGPETEKFLQKKYFGNRWIHSEPPHEYGRTDEMYSRGSHDILLGRGMAQNTVLTLHWTWEVNIGLHHMSKFFSSLPTDYFEDFDA